MQRPEEHQLILRHQFFMDAMERRELERAARNEAWRHAGSRQEATAREADIISMAIA
jgi:hypothetical protein